MTILYSMPKYTRKILHLFSYGQSLQANPNGNIPQMEIQCARLIDTHNILASDPQYGLDLIDITKTTFINGVTIYQPTIIDKTGKSFILEYPNVPTSTVRSTESMLNAPDMLHNWANFSLYTELNVQYLELATQAANLCG